MILNDEFSGWGIDKSHDISDDLNIELAQNAIKLLDNDIVSNP